MIINIGSKNEVKVDALKEVIKEYNFSEAEVQSLEVDSGVSDQPRSLEETVKGAINRSKNSYNSSCDYSFGIESGLMSVPYTETGFMDVCACSIHDGVTTSIGLSSAFEYPIEVTRLVMEEGMDVNQAFVESKLSENEKIGSIKEGAIGFLTRGRVTNVDYTKQAIRMALIQLEYPSLY